MTVSEDSALFGTRECLALVADTSLSGARVARELDVIAAIRGKPLAVVSDNGTELTSTSILRWSQERRVERRYIAPGKPTQNALHGQKGVQPAAMPPAPEGRTRRAPTAASARRKLRQRHPGAGRTDAGAKCI